MKIKLKGQSQEINVSFFPQHLRKQLDAEPGETNVIQNTVLPTPVLPKNRNEPIG